MVIMNFKAFLLSAFLLPGIGQLYKGDKVKGMVFLVLVNIFLLGSVFVVMRKMGAFLLTAKVSGAGEALQLLEKMNRTSPEIGWMLAGFVMIWGVSAADALFAKPGTQVDNV